MNNDSRDGFVTTYVDQVLVSATYDMLVCDSQRINTSSFTFKHMHHFQLVQAPNLSTTQNSSMS